MKKETYNISTNFLPEHRHKEKLSDKGKKAAQGFELNCLVTSLNYENRKAIKIKAVEIKKSFEPGFVRQPYIRIKAEINKSSIKSDEYFEPELPEGKLSESDIIAGLKELFINLEYFSETPYIPNIAKAIVIAQEEGLYKEKDRIYELAEKLNLNENKTLDNAIQREQKAHRKQLVKRFYSTPKESQETRQNIRNKIENLKKEEKTEKKGITSPIEKDTYSEEEYRAIRKTHSQVLANTIKSGDQKCIKDTTARIKKDIVKELHKTYDDEKITSAKIDRELQRLINRTERILKDEETGNKKNRPRGQLSINQSNEIEYTPPSPPPSKTNQLLSALKIGKSKEISK